MNIKRLVDRGLVFFSVVPTLKCEDTKLAVYKMALYRMSEFVYSDIRVFAGSGRCHVYDRIRVRQCYHCQGFVCNADNCSR